METRIDQIADGIYRLSTLVPDIAPPAGFTFNQFLIDADEPLLFHCGPRAMFPLVSAALTRIMPIERLRWISFGHIEGDECGAMNLWLAAAPDAQVVFSHQGAETSVGDMADRPPRGLGEGEVLDLGGKRVQIVPTPHVPHGWEAQVLFEETTRTLFCGDLFAQTGDGGPVTREDLLDAANDAEAMFEAISLTPKTAPTIRKLAALRPERLALMHGATFEGDGADQLQRLADSLDKMLRRQLETA